MGGKGSKDEEDQNSDTEAEETTEVASPGGDGVAGETTSVVADTYTPPPPPDGLRYNLRGPARQGQVTACFRDGCLFRIVNGRVWYFYNDTTKFEMHVTIRFGPDSRLTALKSAQLTREQDGWIVVHAVIYPSETIPFCKGTFKAFSSDVAAKPLSSGYRERLNLATEKEVQRSLDAVIQLAHGRTKVDQILASCVLQQVPFVDMAFPPTAVALSMAGEGTKQSLPRTSWHRPKEFIANGTRRQIPQRAVIVALPSEQPKPRSGSRRGSTASSTSLAAASATAAAENKSASPPVTESAAVKDPKEAGIFVTPVSPNDIEMGELGDNALLGAAAALAEVPSRIQALFCSPPSHDALQGRREQAVGAYRVTLNIDGWWATRIVDDYLPCVAGQPCFARNTSSPAELWVALLEKAYAKAHGSYASIIGGDVMHALTDLTGFPGFRLDAKWANPTTIAHMASLSPLRHDGTARSKQKAISPDMAPHIDASMEVYFSLAAAVHSGHIVVLNTPSSVTAAALQIHGATTAIRLEETFDNAGLRLGQGYAVLDTRSFPAIGVHLLRIRNPWPTLSGKQWQGNWSDQSRSWSTFPAVATSCGTRTLNDGSLWMDWVDVQRFFDGAAVCCIMPSLKHDYRIRGNFNNGLPNLALEVTVRGRPVDAIITISQRDKRHVQRGSVESKYSAVMVTVCRPNATKVDRHDVHKTTTEDPTKPSDGFNFLYGRDVSLMYRFEPQERPYLVVPRAFDAGATKPYTLAFIADRQVDTDSLKVRLRTISAACTLYNNYSSFIYTPSLRSDCEAEYQYRCADDGVPCHAFGVELTSERLPGVPQLQPGAMDGVHPLRAIGAASA